MNGDFHFIVEYISHVLKIYTMQFSLIALLFFLIPIFMTNAQNNFFPLASKSNAKPESEITQYKLQKMNQKFVEIKPENDWQVVYRYYRPPATDSYQPETSTKYPSSTTYEEDKTNTETTTKRQSLVILKKPPKGKDHATYVYPMAAYPNPTKAETTTKKQSLVILKRPPEGKDHATYVYPNAAHAETSTKKQSMVILRRPPTDKDHVTYFYPNAAYVSPQLTTTAEVTYTTPDAYTTEAYPTTTTEAYTTTTTEAYTTTTTDAYTTTTDGSRSLDDAKQSDDDPVVKIGDVLNVSWANAICMVMINAVALGVLWLGGELSWVGRSSSSSSHFKPEVNKWILRSITLNEDEHEGALQSMCVQRAACEAPRAVLLYVHTKEHLTRLLSYFTHLSLGTTGSISEGFLRGGANAGMKKLNCEHLFPCYDFTQH